MSMKCLVLGGGGFLGSHLTEALLRAGHQVRIFERQNRARLPNFAGASSAEWVEGDFVNAADVKAALEGCEVVYHLVSTTLPKTSNDNPAYDLESNVGGTLSLLRQAVIQKIRKIVFISSGGTVYGVPQEIPIKETHPTQPICAYGVGKLAIEKYLHFYRQIYGLNYCVLRLANPFGERQKVEAAQGAVAVFLHKALRGEPIEIWGNGSVVRDYIYVADAAEAMLRAQHQEGEWPVFNIGSGRGHSLNELLQAIEAVVGHKVERRYAPARALDVPANVLDISKAAGAMQWQPQVSFEEGLRRTWEWMRSETAATR